jgi:hypothetical protein
VAEIKNGYQLRGTPVASRPEDRLVGAGKRDHLLVITNDGRVFAHVLAQVEGSFNTVGDAFRFDGPPVATQPEDNHVLVRGNQILVTTSTGRTFAHDWWEEAPQGDPLRHTLGTAYELQGPRLACSPDDNWVLSTGSGIMVIGTDGCVFGHDIAGTTISAPYQYSAPQIAAEPEDNWVLTLGGILVIKQDGRVFRYHVTDRTIKEASQIEAPLVAANPEDKWVGELGTTILVVTRSGTVFAYPTSGLEPAIR